MKLKLDENLSKAAAEIFRQAGHNTESVVSQGMAGSPDQKVISVCQSEKRCLVTLDLDFANPLIFPPNQFYGIAVFRLPPDQATAIYLLFAGPYWLPWDKKISRGSFGLFRKTG